jgi:hypothetical protein
MADLYPDLKDRPLKETICLFDVDNTLTPARLSISPEMRQTLARLRHKCAIGYVSCVPSPTVVSPISRLSSLPQQPQKFRSTLPPLLLLLLLDN